jgi:hypothetical protein|tara:strand:+ start:467 stop:952 length:486 start_codon:yes stop_codon:yes gene_type:complete
MSFIRTKKIDGKEYAYLVENKWYKRKVKAKGRGPRQRVSKYLGRVYYFNKTNNNDFFNYSDIKDLEQYLKNNKNKIFRDLVEWELFRHSINKNDVTIDYTNKKIIKNNKEVSLRINEGFLNSFTLKRLFNLRAGNSYFLAKCFVDAGVEIPKEIFVGIFGR